MISSSTRFRPLDDSTAEAKRTSSQVKIDSGDIVAPGITSSSGSLGTFIEKDLRDDSAEMEMRDDITDGGGGTDQDPPRACDEEERFNWSWRSTARLTLHQLLLGVLPRAT